jgi:hypothetical protein
MLAVVRNSVYRFESGSRLPGPLDSEEYDALFAKPGSRVFGESGEPALVRGAVVERDSWAALLRRHCLVRSKSRSAMRAAIGRP